MNIFFFIHRNIPNTSLLTNNLWIFIFNSCVKLIHPKLFYSALKMGNFCFEHQSIISQLAVNIVDEKGHMLNLTSLGRSAWRALHTQRQKVTTQDGVNIEFLTKSEPRPVASLTKGNLYLKGTYLLPFCIEENTSLECQSHPLLHTPGSATSHRGMRPHHPSVVAHIASLCCNLLTILYLPM